MLSCWDVQVRATLQMNALHVANRRGGSVSLCAETSNPLAVVRVLMTRGYEIEVPVSVDDDSI